MKKKILISIFFVAIAMLTHASAYNSSVADKKADASLQYTSGGHVLSFNGKGVIIASTSHALKVNFKNANRVMPDGGSLNQPDLNPLDDKKQLPSMSKVTYSNVWKNITLEFQASGENVYETTYRLNPDGQGRIDAAHICLVYNRDLSLNKNGNLEIHYPNGTFIESAPVAWQEVNGVRKPVSVNFRLHGKHELGFELGNYIKGIPVVIDPTLSWVTFLGGTGDDVCSSIATDSQGYIYVCGSSAAVWGSPISSNNGGSSCFIAKLDSTGTLLWHTFFGTNSSCGGIAVDANYNIFVCGGSTSTWSSPIRSYTSGSDGFVAKFNSSGTFLWNTFLGGSGTDFCNGLAVDASGNAYIVGMATGTWGSPVRAFSGNTASDAFAAKVSSAGVLTWNSFFGANSSYDNRGSGIAVSANGYVYIAGSSVGSWGSPVRAYTSATSDAFIAKLNISSGALIWNTFIGGSGGETCFGIALDASDNAYITGCSTATFGTPIVAFLGSVYDVFVAKVTSSGALAWNTFGGGNGNSIKIGRKIALDANNNIYVSGNVVTTFGSPINAYSGNTDNFVMKLNSSGVRSWLTFVGGSNDDYNNGMVLNPNKTSIYISGQAYAGWGTPIRAYTSEKDGFVAKIANDPVLTTPIVSNISVTTATGNDSILDLGCPASVTAHGICWSSTNSTPTLSDSYVTNGTRTTTGGFTTTMTGLTAGTTYHVRAYATNGAGTSYSSVLSFTTLIVPTVTTQTVSNVTTTTATMNGVISSLGNPASVIAYGACWSNSNSLPSLSDSYVTNGSTTTAGNFSSSLTGLIPGTTYYVRAYATNAVGTSYSDVIVVFTAQKSPTIGTSAVNKIDSTTTVTLDAVSNISETSASVNMSVYCDSATSASFTYGVCYSSMHTPTVSDTLVAGDWAISVGKTNTPVVKTKAISNLVAGKTYYLRAYATSSTSGKTFYSAIDTIKTIPIDIALNFDGANDYIAIPDNNLLDLTANYTITAWIRPETFSLLAGIVSKYQTLASNGYTFRLSRTSPYMGLDFDNQYTSTSTNILAANTWYHVAAVKSGTTRIIYLNGTSMTLSGTAITTVANADTLKIGCDYANRFFDGTIDEVSIWSKALSQSEIQDAMTNGFAGTESNLVAYYKFNQGTASGTNTGITTLTDASSNHLTGYLRNIARTGTSSNFVSGAYRTLVINKNISTNCVKDITTRDASLQGSYSVQVNNVSSTSTHTYKYGMCWSSTNSSPTMVNSTYVTAGGGTITGEGTSACNVPTFTVSPTANGQPLTAGTTYYARAYLIIDSTKTYYGNVVTFSTLADATSIVSNIGGTTATVSGNIYSLGTPANVTAYGVCYSSTNTVPTLSDSYVNKGTTTTTGSYNATLTGLNPLTTYYARTYATNAVGTVYGSVVSFTTLKAPIITTSAVNKIDSTTTVTLDAISNIAQTTASANLSIHCDSSTAVSFTYGVCYSTAHTPTTSDLVVSGSSAASVSNSNTPVTNTLTISNLTEGKTYYVRAYATSSALGKTFYSSVDTIKTVELNRAMNFDGVNDYIAIPDNNLLDLTTNYTIAAWIKPEVFSWLGGIVSKYQTVASKGYDFRLSDNSPYQGFDFDEMYTTNSTDLISANTWYYVAAVKSGSTRSIYVNGTSVSLSGTAFTTLANTDSVKIGCDYVNRFFDGTIDEVSIWSKALSQTEIQAGMANGFTGTESNLVAYYKFNQGSASGTNTGITTLTDASSNNLTGYLRNIARTGTSSNFVSGAPFLVQLINKNISTDYVKDITTRDASLQGSYFVQVNNVSSTSTHTYKYGICWSSTNSTPTVVNSTYIAAGRGTLTGEGSTLNNGLGFTVSLSANNQTLTAGTTYYARAYLIIDSTKTYYGNVVTFSTLTNDSSTVTNIGGTTATVSGNIHSLGTPASITAYGVCYSSSNTVPTLSDSYVNKGSTTTIGSYTTPLTGLTPVTTYYARAYATNASGTVYGNVVSFTTLAGSVMPVVSTQAASSITVHTAIANGTIVSLGTPANATAYGVCWSTTNSTPTLSDSVINKGSTTSTGSFTANLTNLTEGTTYYLRAYATNGTGTGYGEVVSFTTPQLPQVSTQAASNIKAISANLNGTISSLGSLDSIAAYGFCWSSSNTTPTVTDNIVSNGSTKTTKTFSDTITGLLAGTTYYVRAYATNATGTVYGNVVSFTTRATVQLSLKAYLQALWNGSSMNQCYDENTNPIIASAVDTITVELHSASSYGTIVHSLHGLYLDTDGNIHSNGLSYIQVPGNYSGSYYITIKTRNHLATTTASVVSFADSTASYDFSSAANKAYGSNMIAVATGIYAFYAGDVNQDGNINSTDVTMINTKISNFASGYLPEDINGDGTLDASDIDLIEPNVNNSVSVLHP